MKSNPFPCLPQIWSLAWCMLGCCLLFSWVWLFWISEWLAWAGARGRSAEASSLRAAGAQGLLLPSGVSCATACLVGVQFHFEHSVHHLCASKMLCDLMWDFSSFPLYRRQKLQVPKNKRTRYRTQKYPWLLKSPGLFFTWALYVSLELE